MAVIAKMRVAGTRVFGDGRLVTLSCVYDNDLSKPENEDVRFTKATPWGEAHFSIDNMVDLAFDENLYLVFHPSEDDPDFAGAIMAALVRCHSLTDFGGTSRNVELHSAYSESDKVPDELRMRKKGAVAINLKMAIDNPAASTQFVPQSHYWLMFYRAERPVSELVEKARPNAPQELEAAEA
jgi:hypothetical protein